MLVTYTNTAEGGTGNYALTLAAKTGKITRILRVEGTRKTTTLLGTLPYISITNLMNTDGTTYTATYMPEEEGGGAGGGVRRARAVLFDPPWRSTVKPGQDSLITYSPGVGDEGNATLIVGYKYE